MTDHPWRISIDRGGTFTDAIAVDPEGNIHFAKVLSEDSSPLSAIAQLLSHLPTESAHATTKQIRLGTTLATNALLEKKGERHALLTTIGFVDALRIGNQQRSVLFTTAIPPRWVLPEDIQGVPERMDAKGTVLVALDEVETRIKFRGWRNQGFQSVAIHFMHACANPIHEILAGRWAREEGFEYVALSHQSDPTPGFIARGETVCADAYLTPCLRNQMETLANGLPNSNWLCMQSDGSLVALSEFRGPQALLSGPAGGWLACRTLIERLGIAKALAFDMGGTSTDISRCVAYQAPYFEPEVVVAGLRLRTPTVSIDTIASGGGSLCRIRAGRLCVGPESAGSNPGPLCYGRVKPKLASLGDGLTITDVNLYLGRLHRKNFPFQLNLEPVAMALEAQCQYARAMGLGEFTAITLALGYRQIVDHAMAQAIRSTAQSKGEDVSNHPLIVFGGAGGQHACAVAANLGITHIIMPPLAGIFSAVGISQASQGWNFRQYVTPERLVKSSLENANIIWRQGEKEAISHLPQGQIHFRYCLFLRYTGTDQEWAVFSERTDDLNTWISAFEKQHEKWFGYLHQGRDIEWIGIQVEASIPTSSPWPGFNRVGIGMNIEPLEFQTEPFAAIFENTREPIPCWTRPEILPGEIRQGPAILLESTGTVIVEPGWQVECDSDGNLHLTPLKTLPTTLAQGPAELSLFHASFMSIAEEMGRILRRTAVSTNIKDRLDFSCALFDEHGRLIANAPHIPVHLGAMGESVRHIVKRFPAMAPGDAFLTNHPEYGGSHLPDLTVVSPVFGDSEDSSDASNSKTIQPLFFVANRAHHADIGGIEPGSMPAFSKRLEEEGIIIDALRLVHAGHFAADEVEALFRSGPYPARNLSDILADLAAQIAANRAGGMALRRLCQAQTPRRVVSQMQALFENARKQVQTALTSRMSFTRKFMDSLDEGGTIAVELGWHNQGFRVDFSGTSGPLPNNFNVPSSVVRSCLLYTLRCLVTEDIPLNEGCLEDIEWILPRPSLLAPPPGAAIVAGNVETSQRIVDVLWGAFGMAAASQGTMNNLTFGNDAFGYYETLGGGEGGSEGHRGSSAVHTHMTNTRLTDPELLEMRYPVRLESFSIRKNSGGDGKFPGGDGMIREYRFLKRVQISLLTQRRIRNPYGMNGGKPGQAGKNIRKLINGEMQTLPGSITYTADVGESLRIETPGGGGWTVQS